MVREPAATPAQTGLADAVRGYRDALAARGLAANSLEAYGRDLQRYLGWMSREGVAHPGDVTAEDLTAFVAALIAGDPGHRPLSPASAARAMAAVRGFHRYAVEAGLAEDDPARQVRGPAPQQAPPRTLSAAEVSALLGCSADGPLGLRDRALVHLLFATAARIGEVIGLDVADVEPGATTVRLPARGAGPRVVDLEDESRTALHQYLSRGRPLLADPTNPALVLNARGGRLTRQAAWQLLGAVAERAGIPEISPQDLRSTRAAQLLDAGTPIAAVQALLGHASSSTTSGYRTAPQRGPGANLRA